MRFIKLLYMLVCPAGPYHPARYDPSRRAAAPRRPPDPSPERPSTSVLAGGEPQRQPRIHPVVPSRFRRGRLLGKGGQGCVYAGEYDGLVCAGKVRNGSWFVSPAFCYVTVGRAVWRRVRL